MNRRILLPLLLLAAAAVHAASLPSHVYRKVEGACVLVQAVRDGKGSSGSGFFVSRNTVITNHHVVKDAVEGDAAVSLVIDGASPKRKVAPATVVGADEEHDLALLRTDHKARVWLTFLSDRLLRVTDPVWVIGFPFGARAGLEITVTSGTISSLRRNDDGVLEKVQIDAAVNRGNSGGPVVNAAGKVVGITRATIDPKVGSGMAIAIPSGLAEAFAAKAARRRSRTKALTMRGKTNRRGIRIVRVVKSDEVWGTAVRFTVRGSRGLDEIQPLLVEFVDKRRERIREETLDVGDLRPREEKVIEIRLRGIAFDDVAKCHVID